jgi:hypothetical protein
MRMPGTQQHPPGKSKLDRRNPRSARSNLAAFVHCARRLVHFRDSGRARATEARMRIHTRQGFPRHIARFAAWPAACKEQLETKAVRPSHPLLEFMKTSTRKPLLLGLFGIAVATLLSSCVDPYAQNQGYSQQQVTTTYRTGYEVRSLPSGYRTEVIGGTQYYNHNGTYYRPRSGRYVVVEAPRPSRDAYSRSDRYDRRDGHVTVIRTLPRGYRTVTHRGTRYYQANNTYYQQQGSGYVIVRSPF